MNEIPRPVYGAVCAFLLNLGVVGMLWFTDDRRDRPIRAKGLGRLEYILGGAETLLFFVSAWTRRYELAGAWLIFKLGTKWNAWQHIVGLDTGAQWKDRDARASWMTTRFLTGTLCNLVAALIAVYLTQHAHRFW
jgi:hypothetical protein